MTSRSAFSCRTLLLFLAASVSLGCLPAAAQVLQPAVSQSAAKLAPRIQTAVDDRVLTQLKDGLSPAIHHDADQGDAPADLVLSKMVLLLKRAPDVQAALDLFTADQQDPHSPSFHQWLTPEQMGERFGIAPEDLAQVCSWLRSHGFQIDSVAHSGLVILFSGTQAQLQQAFHTSLHVFADKATGEKHFANITEPSVPTALSPVVSGIASLNNYPFKPMHRILGSAHRDGSTGDWSVKPLTVASKAGKQELPVAETAPGLASPQFSTTLGTSKFQAVSPYDFATIYNVKPLWDAGIDGTGQTVAVLAVSDINPADVASFRSTFGLPVNPINLVYVGPNPGILGGGSEQEADLDAQWSGAVAKNATIDVVVAADTATTDGLVLGAYDVVDNNLASVLSVSFGQCELGLGNAGNQLFSSIWQQAAAEGITVTIASGDAGSAACDQGSGSAAVYGLAVNGLASTSYNVAVGGTDLYGTYTSPSTYWSSTNDPTTLKSALNYVPEIPWNDSCGNPQYLAALHAHNKALSDSTNEALCNDTTFYSGIFVIAGGGGGGTSNCTNSVYVSVYSFNCYNGYSQPAWQTGVVGIPANHARNIPDISLFAGDGLWGSAYVFCSSDNTPDGTCNYANTTDAEYLAAGGTSFGTPAFAGIMALINQKTASRQGNANPTLYRLAATQLSAAVPAACDATVATAGSTCLFQDISIGNNAEPCVGGSRNCSPVGYYSVYTALPGYSAGAGYDSATGLGSLNVANVTNAWASVTASFAPSKTSLTLSQSTFVYGGSASGTITVVAASGSSVPTGDVGIVTAGYGNGPFTLTGGKTTVSIVGLGGGSHTLAAHYGGDSTFAASDSPATSIVVQQAPTSLFMKAGKSALYGTDNVTLTSTVATTSTAANPTGTITFTDSTTGNILGTAALQPTTDTQGHSIATGGITISGHLLAIGNNTVVASYPGDANYLNATAAAVALTYTSPFTLTASQPSLALHLNNSGSMTVTVTAATGKLLQDVFLACPQTLPSGLSCVFSPAILPAGSTSTTSTLTIYASAAVGSVRTPATPQGHSWHSQQVSLAGLSFAGIFLWLLLGLLIGKRRSRLASLLTAIMTVAIVSIAGCSSTTAYKPTSITLTTSAATVGRGNAVTFTGTVTGSSALNGPVTFAENGSTLGTSNINTAGVATFTTTALPVGNHSVTATFGGSYPNQSSTSTPVTTDVTLTTGIQLAATDPSANVSTITVPVTVQ